MHGHALGGQGLGVEPAQGEDADEAVVIDVAHDEADFIHVSGAHDLLIGALALDEAGDVADVVYLHAVGQRSHLAQDELADAVLEARGAGGLAQFLEELNVHRALYTPFPAEWQGEIGDAGVIFA